MTSPRPQGIISGKAGSRTGVQDPQNVLPCKADFPSEGQPETEQMLSLLWAQLTSVPFPHL